MSFQNEVFNNMKPEVSYQEQIDRFARDILKRIKSDILDASRKFTVTAAFVYKGYVLMDTTYFSESEEIKDLSLIRFHNKYASRWTASQYAADLCSKIKELGHSDGITFGNLGALDYYDEYGYGQEIMDAVSQRVVYVRSCEGTLYSLPLVREIKTSEFNHRYHFCRITNKDGTFQWHDGGPNLKFLALPFKFQLKR